MLGLLILDLTLPTPAHAPLSSDGAPLAGMEIWPPFAECADVGADPLLLLESSCRNWWCTTRHFILPRMFNRMFHRMFHRIFHRLFHRMFN